MGTGVAGGTLVPELQVDRLDGSTQLGRLRVLSTCWGVAVCRRGPGTSRGQAENRKWEADDGG